MSNEFKISQLSFGSLFKILFNANLVFWALGGAMAGVASLAGLDTVTFNGEPVHGATGLALGIVVALIVGCIFGVISSLVVAFVTRLCSGFLPFQNGRLG